MMQSHANDPIPAALRTIRNGVDELITAVEASLTGFREMPQGPIQNNSPMPNGPPPAVAELTDSQKFKALRERAGLSQARAAKLCDVDPSTVYRWENGKQVHTHKAKNPQLTRGLDLMRWAVDKREERGCTAESRKISGCKQIGCAHAVTVTEMAIETARRAKRKT